MDFSARQPISQSSARLVAAVCSVIYAAIASIPASAQIVPDAGSTLRQLEPPTLILPRKPPPEPQIEKPARPVLEPAPDIRFVVKGFRIAGVTVFQESELQPLLQDLLGREVRIPELGEAVGRITRFYSERGYPLATAYLPVQDIRDGVVEIVVLEGRIGSIQLLNRTRVRESVVAAYLEPLPGRVIEDAALERQLLLTYDLPGVAPARVVLVPGEAVGESDLRLELAPGRFVTGSVELDNFGNHYTGTNQFLGQLGFLSPARLGDLLSVNVTKASHLTSGGVRYQLPVGGHGLRVGAGYTYLRYSLSGDFEALDASGEARSTTAFAQYPLVRSRQSNLYGGVSYEHRLLQDRIGVTSTVTDKKADFVQLALSGDFFDSWGGSAANAYALRYGHGNLDIESPVARAIDSVTTRTDGSYHKWNWNFVRLQGLTERLSAYLAFYGQKAGDNLDSSEKMILGGIYGVRAYPQGEAAGDSGYVLNGEVRYAFNLETVPGSFQVAAFLDTGEVTLLENPFAPLPNHRRLSGGGLSLAWGRPGDFSLRATVAHRIGNARAAAGTDVQTRGWLQAIKNF